MKAVMYGAGNIGRGFIGALLSQAGYAVTFIDVNKSTVDALNERHSYPLRILSNDGFEDLEIKNVCAIDGNDKPLVAKAIAGADIMATAVGANILKIIAPNIADGIRLRLEISQTPLDILICENLMDADQHLAGLIMENLTPKEVPLFKKQIGLVEASIGRMVPVQTDALKDSDPLRVCVERYRWLPVDKDAIKGDVPNIEGLVPYSPFGYYIKRKLFVHNMGHAFCAYLSSYTGYQYIWQAVNDPDIYILVKNAMLEGIQAIAAEYSMSLEPLLLHIEDLLLRFTNQALGDTCVRVGADPTRKLGPSDRLVGAARLCESQGILCPYISVAIAAAVHRYLYDAELPQSTKGAQDVLISLSGIGDREPLFENVMKAYALFAEGTRPAQLRCMIERESSRRISDVI